MKKVLMMVLCLTILVSLMFGCGEKKQVEQEADQPVEEAVEEAAVDTAAAAVEDTAAAQVEE